MADTLASGASARKGVGVQLPSSASQTRLPIKAKRVLFLCRGLLAAILKPLCSTELFPEPMFQQAWWALAFGRWRRHGGASPTGRRASPFPPRPELAVTFYDTADTYDDGGAETILTEAFKPKPRPNYDCHEIRLRYLRLAPRPQSARTPAQLGAVVFAVRA